MTFTAFHFIAPNDLGPVAQAAQHQLWISVVGQRRQRPNDKSLDAQSFQLSAGNDDCCMDPRMKQKKRKEKIKFLHLPASTWSFRRPKQSRRRRRAARFPYTINNGGKRGGRKKKTAHMRKAFVPPPASGIDKWFCASYDSEVHAVKIVEGLLNSARGELNQTQEGPPLEGKDAASCRSKSQLYLSPALSFPIFLHYPRKPVTAVYG